MLILGRWRDRLKVRQRTRASRTAEVRLIIRSPSVANSASEVPYCTWDPLQWGMRQAPADGYPLVWESACRCLPVIPVDAPQGLAAHIHLGGKARGTRMECACSAPTLTPSDSNSVATAQRPRGQFVSRRMTTALTPTSASAAARPLRSLSRAAAALAFERRRPPRRPAAAAKSR